MIEPQVIALVVFSLIAMVCAAVGMLVRDLVATRMRRDGRRESIVIREVPAFMSQDGGLTNGINKSLYRLVSESGTGWTMWTALLAMTLSGAAIGGISWVASENPVLSCALAAAGFALPLPWLAFRRHKHLKLIRKQLPDALDLLARAVRAGESLEQAVDLVGERTPAPLGFEFQQCSKQLQLGISVPGAFRAMSKRIPITELKILSATLSVFRQTGGNLATTLDRLARVIRDRITYQRQLRSTTAAGRFSATLVAVIGPLLFAYMMIFQQEYFNKLISIRIGQVLLALALVLEVVGIVWVMRLLKSRY